MSTTKNKNTKLYQTHRGHIEAIMPTAAFVEDFLPKMFDDSEVYRKVHTEVSTEDIPTKTIDVYSLRYGQEIMSMLVLIADWENNPFLSTYPMLSGKTTKVTIDEVLEWDNKIEATIQCSIDNFHFAFFACDYYENKKFYIVGEELLIDISALGCKVKEASRGFSFEGTRAMDFLSTIGKKTDIDENGNIQPIKFNTEKLVVFLNYNKRCPDEAEFQSPVVGIETTSLLGVDFYTVEITINRDEDDNDISIPLYFRKDMFPNIKEEDPVEGWIWILGHLTSHS